jgi:hypothetical protein
MSNGKVPLEEEQTDADMKAAAVLIDVEYDTK